MKDRRLIDYAILLAAGKRRAAVLEQQLRERDAAERQAAESVSKTRQAHAAARVRLMQLQSDLARQTAAAATVVVDALEAGRHQVQRSAAALAAAADRLAQAEAAGREAAAATQRARQAVARNQARGDALSHEHERLAARLTRQRELLEEDELADQGRKRVR